MGRLMRRHWVPALLSEQVAEPDGAPVRVQLLARSSSRSVTVKARSGCSAKPVRTARPRWPSAATRNAACAASITAGSSTPTAMSSTCPRSRRRARCRRRPRICPIPCAKLAALSGPIWDRRTHAGIRGAAMGTAHRRRTTKRASRSPKSSCPATGRRSWRARSIRRIRPRCMPPTCGPRKARQPRRAITGFGRRPDRIRASRFSSPITACAMLRSAGRSRTPNSHDTCASRLMSRPSLR